jgi:hypothetical protein
MTTYESADKLQNSYLPELSVRVVPTKTPALVNRVIATPASTTSPVLSLFVSSLTVPEMHPKSDGVGTGVKTGWPEVGAGVLDGGAGVGKGV